MKPGRSQAFRRSVAISVSVSYLTTQVFFSSGFTPTASAAGMPDVWKDRAASLSHKRNTPSLSLSLTSPTSLPLKAFPAVDPLLQVTAPFLRVQSVHAGRANAPAVLLVQDVHLNAPAQRNIGLALNRISGRGVVINVEAAHGKFDFAPHRQFPDPAVRKEIADFLLRENFISAVSWMGLTAPVTPSTVGVDDASLYVQNVEAFKAAARIKDRALGQIHKNAGALAARRQHILSPTLNSLSNKIVAYHKGEVPIHEFASALSSYVSVGAASSVAKLMEATRLEKSLDNAAAQRERNELLQKLSNNRRVSSELVALGAAFQSGAMDAMMFHVALSKLFAREGVDLASAPHFDRYLRYVTLADGIDHSKLFQELSAMTEAAINTPAATSEQRAIMKDTIHLCLAEKLVHFELTPEEWEAYRRSMDQDSNLSSFESFYRLAQARSEKMVENLAPVPLSVLVAGGFHTPDILALLHKKGFSTVVLTPKMEGPVSGRGSDYLNVFLRERSPLAKIFQGEKLTLADSATLPGAPKFGAAPVPTEAINTAALLNGLAAAADSVITPDEQSAIAAGLGQPVKVTAEGNGNAVIESNGMITTVDPNATAANASLNGVLGHNHIRIETRSDRAAWWRRALSAFLSFFKKKKVSLLDSPPEKIFMVKMKVQMDNGEEREFKGYRIHDNGLMGPGKGGIRFHPDVDQVMIAALAHEMTEKLAVLGLPLGGAKGGVAVDPRQLSKGELERLMRAYVDELDRLGAIGPDIDIPAPDVGTTAELMEIFADQYVRNRTALSLEEYLKKADAGEINGALHSVVTGKPVGKGGLNGRKEATGLGIYFVAREAVRHYKIGAHHAEGEGMTGLTVALQGLGNVGFYTAKFFHEHGARIVSVGEYINGKNVVFEDQRGIDIIALRKLLDEKAPLETIAKLGFVFTEENGVNALFREADVVIPAAMEKQLKADNVLRLSPKVKLIVEAANGPTTPEAFEILKKTRPDIVLVPDILANAGGVFVSYLEYLANRRELADTSEAAVQKNLETRITKAAADVFTLADRDNLPPKEAALRVAEERLSEKKKESGKRSWKKRLALLAFGSSVVFFVSGANGGDIGITIVSLLAMQFAVYKLFRLVQHVRRIVASNRHILVKRRWQWVYAFYPVRIYINGTGRTGVPNVLQALHSPGFDLVAVNGLQTEKGSTKLENLTEILEDEELFKNYAPYDVSVVAAGRAWKEADGTLWLTRNIRPDGNTFLGEREKLPGLRQRIQFLRDRFYARRLMAKLDRLQPDWRKVWSENGNAEGQARLEWLDVRVNGRVRRVLFFNARNDKAQFFPARPLNIVGMSETSGAVLERKKQAPYFGGSSSNGVQIAVLGAPPKDKTDNIPLNVLGVNHRKIFDLTDMVLSNCSCTTNGGVPLLYALSAVPVWLGWEAVEVLQAHMTTTHAPTVSDQDTIDVAKEGKKSEGRSPASGTQTIATTTGFLDVAKPVLESAGITVGPISGISFRVPANPSKVNLSMDVLGLRDLGRLVKIYIVAAGITDPLTIEALLGKLNEVRVQSGLTAVPLEEVLLTPFEESVARKSPLKGIIRLISEPSSYSSKYVQSDASTVLNIAHLMLQQDPETGKHRVDMSSWYSNEWGYAARTLETLRAFAMNYWQRRGLFAFLRHTLFGWLPAPDIPVPSQTKKKEEEKKTPAPLVFESLQSKVQGVTVPLVLPKPSAPRIAVSFNASDKVQLNKAMMHLWNFLYGDKRVNLRAVVGVPRSWDGLAAFVKLMMEPSNYPHVIGKVELIPANETQDGFKNPNPYPVLRHYRGDEMMAEVALLPSDYFFDDNREKNFLDVSTVLEMGNRNAAQKFVDAGFLQVVLAPSLPNGRLFVPGVVEPKTEAPIGTAMSSRALAAFYMASALSKIPNNRLSFLSVQGVVFSKGENPLLTGMSGRQADGNIQMKSFSDTAALQTALNLSNIGVKVSGSNDVVNSQSGSLIQITATLANDITEDPGKAIEEVKTILKAYVKKMTAQGYRIILASGKERIFASDKWNVPGIIINTDSIEVNNNRQVVMSAWFDDRLTDLNAMNEALIQWSKTQYPAEMSPEVAALVAPIVEEFGTVYRAPLTINIWAKSDGVGLRANLPNYRYRQLQDQSLDLRLMVPLLLRGHVDVKINFSKGNPFAVQMEKLFEDLRNGSDAQLKRWPEWSRALARLESLGDPAILVSLLENIQAVSEMDAQKLPDFLGHLNSGEPMYRSLTADRLHAFANYAIRLSVAVISGKGNEIKIASILGTIQQEALRRLAGPLTEAERTTLIIVNEATFHGLIDLAFYNPGYNTIGQIFENFSISEEYGLTFDTGIWGQEESYNWNRFHTLVNDWINERELPTLFRFGSAISFARAIGYRSWQRLMSLVFQDAVNVTGRLESEESFSTGAVPVLIAAWKRIDTSGNDSDRRVFYKIAVEIAKVQKNLGSLLELAGLDKDLLPRVLSVIALVYEMMRWSLIDKNMPWPFLVYVLRKAGPYSAIKFKQMLAGALLRRAPAEFGIPPDDRIKDSAVSEQPIDPDNLYGDGLGLDAIVRRHVHYRGVDAAALELVAARTEYQRTGNPDAAIAACRRHAPEQSLQSLKPGAPNPVVARLCEILSERLSVPVHDVVGEVGRLTEGEAMSLQRELEQALPDHEGEIKRFFSTDLVLFRELTSRLNAPDGDINLLRGLSYSGMPINADNLNKDVYDLDKLIHREVHHGTGEHTLDLVRARLHYWRTGDLSEALELAEKYAPDVTASWRANAEAQDPPDPLMQALFRTLAETRGVSEKEIPTAVLASLSNGELTQLRETLEKNAKDGNELLEIKNLFERHIRLYHLLKDRYDPARWESALAHLRAANIEGIDFGPLLEAIDKKREVKEQIDRLVKVRAQMKPYFLGNPDNPKYEKLEYERLSYREQHGLRGVYGYTEKDPYFRVFRLDLYLQLVEARILEEARHRFSANHVSPETYIRQAADLLASMIRLLEFSGWSTQTFRNLEALLADPNLTPARLALLCDRLLYAFQNFDHLGNRLWGDIIDTFSDILRFEDLPDSLAAAMKISNDDELRHNRLRLRPQVLGDTLRRNSAFFLLKDAAMLIKDKLAAGPASPTVRRPRKTAEFFPETIFGREPFSEILSAHSEKGANLVRMGRLNVPVPPGVLYPIGMDKQAIHARVWDDIQHIVQKINTNDLIGTFGTGFGNFANGPILFSIRSGAIFDAPGQMHTITNWGISEKNIDRLSERIGPWAAWDSLRRYYQEFGMAVLEIDRAVFNAIIEAVKKEKNKSSKIDLSPDEMREVALKYKQKIFELKGPQALPESLEDQLYLIIDAIQGSWDNKSMRDFRQSEGMMEEEGTVVILQAQAHGNYSRTDSDAISGAGVVFSGIWPWDPAYGSFAQRVEGSDIADGVITPEELSVLARRAPALYAEINSLVYELREAYGTRVQLEYTIQNGKLWVLQIRSVPEERTMPGFDPQQIAKAPVLANGYWLSGNAAKGPVVALHHLRMCVDFLEGIIKQDAERGLHRSLLKKGGYPVDRLKKFIMDVGESVPMKKDQRHSIDTVLVALDTVAYMRREDPAHAEQIGILLASDQALPEDLVYVRYLNELVRNRVVVGWMANKGGPGTHEQENAAHLGLTAMAGTEFGGAPSHINLGGVGTTTLGFEHDTEAPRTISEGKRVVSMIKVGRYMDVLLGDLSFESQPNGSLVPSDRNASPLPAAIFGPGWWSRTVFSPVVEEAVFRYGALVLLPILGRVLYPEVSVVLFVGFGFALAILGNIVAHIFTDGRKFPERFFKRLSRSAARTLEFALVHVPLFVVLRAIDPSTPILAALFAGVPAVIYSWGRHVIINSRIRTKRELNLLREEADLLLLLNDLMIERQEPGSKEFMKVIAISDQHGAIEKFDALILDAIKSVLPKGQIPDFELDHDKGLDEQLGRFGVTLAALKGKIFFQNLGDFMDRGLHGIKVYERSRELVDAGLSNVVIGNHCHWLFQSLLGLHLPSYKKFNFHGYMDGFDRAHGKVQDLLARYHKTAPETKTKEWWAERWIEYNAFHAEAQKTVWSKTVAPKVKELWSQVEHSVIDNPKHRALWNKLRGWNGNTDIYTGARAVGTVSLKWWQDLADDFEKELKPSLSSRDSWADAINMMRNDIILPLTQETERRLAKGDWWYRVLEAINHYNYRSPQWWAKDWPFHPGWGPTVMEEMNARIADPNKKVTAANYFSNEKFQEICLWYKSNYHLYQRDIYQNVYLHANLPVDMETGEFHFIYRSREYRGKDVWKGLKKIGEDVRNASTLESTLEEAEEALELVNSWYADATTIAKPWHLVAAVEKFGPDRLAEINGFNRLFLGHTPLHEFAKQGGGSVITGFQTGQRIFNIDMGMDVKFGGRGGYVVTSPDGIALRGYEHSKHETIIDSPRTVNTVAEEGGIFREEVLFENRPIERNVFLPRLIDDVQRRIAELRAGSTKRGMSVYFAGHLFSFSAAAGMAAVGVVAFFIGALRALRWRSQYRLGEEKVAIILAVQSLPDYGLRRWTSTSADVWKERSGTIDQEREVAYFSLQDLLDAQALALESQTARSVLNLHLSMIENLVASRMNTPGLIMTIPTGMTEGQAMMALTELTGKPLPMGRILFDINEKADPYRVAETFGGALNGRRIHAMPYRHARFNWDLRRFLAGADRSRILIELIDLLSGLSMKLEGSVADKVLAGKESAIAA